VSSAINATGTRPSPHGTAYEGRRNHPPIEGTDGDDRDDGDAVRRLTQRVAFSLASFCYSTGGGRDSSSFATASSGGKGTNSETGSRH
jgi:hypothetical protein